MIAADFEALSHQVQKQIGLSEYLVPVLVGYSSGATVVYATLVQSPPGHLRRRAEPRLLRGSGFRRREPVPGAGLHYTPQRAARAGIRAGGHAQAAVDRLPGQKDRGLQRAGGRAVRRAGRATAEIVTLPLVGHGFSVERNWMPQFREAYARLSAAAAEPASAPPPDIGDLPLQEVHASGSAAEFALLLTGDGGWAGLDQELAARLAASGVPTVGLNSLKYFWKARTPEEAARDVARILRHYLAAWNKQRVLLVGYSFGADVLPFVVNRLPADLRRARGEREPARDRRQRLLRGARVRLGRRRRCAVRTRGPKSRASRSCRCCACTARARRTRSARGCRPEASRRASRSAPATTSAASTRTLAERILRLRARLRAL